MLSVNLRHILNYSMKKNIPALLLLAVALSSCGDYNKVLKSTDYQYKYEAAKSYYLDGKNTKATTVLNDVITILKGSDKAEESLYMLGMAYYNNKEWLDASTTFKKYAKTYPQGEFAELAAFTSLKALYNDTPEPRLDQTSTYQAISDIQLFCEMYPRSVYKEEAQDMLFKLQDRLVEKELFSAKLYYNLGNYMGNNYQSCVITAQNAMRDFPYTSRREELSMLVLRAKYQMAVQSVPEKQTDRYRDAVDEYYAFKNEFPESNNMKEAEHIFEQSSKRIKE